MRLASGTIREFRFVYPELSTTLVMCMERKRPGKREVNRYRCGIKAFSLQMAIDSYLLDPVLVCCAAWSRRSHRSSTWNPKMQCTRSRQSGRAFHVEQGTRPPVYRWQVRPVFSLEGLLRFQQIVQSGVSETTAK